MVANTTQESFIKTRFIIKFYNINRIKNLEIKPIKILKLRYYTKNPLSI